MNSAWNIGKIAGIQVRVHWTFLLLLGWIAGSYLLQGSGIAAALLGLSLVLAVFLCIVLHELGHALAARQFGIETRDITLLPIGGVARLERLPREPLRELWIAVAGPLVNVAIAGGLAVVLGLMGAALLRVPEQPIAEGFQAWLRQLLWVNLFIVGFNLLPAFPTDGGRVLRALLATRMSYERATGTAAGVGQTMAILFALAALLWNPWLLLIALFIFMAAGAEAREVRLNEAMRQFVVHQAMMTEFRTLRVDDTLQHAAEQLLAGAQQDFPVADSSGVVGVLTRHNLIAAYCGGNGHRQVREAMTPVDRTLPADMRLPDALQQLRELKTTTLPVVRGGQVVGLLTSENISELLMLRCDRGEEAPWTPAQAV